VESRGYEIFSSSRKKWRQVYDNKKDMRVLYNGWERWITTMGADIKIEDRGSGSEIVKFSYGPNTNSECSNLLN
jgi:hypothetical protein